MKLRLTIKITAFILLMQAWMPYFVNGTGKEYVEYFFKLLAIYLCLNYYEQTKVDSRIERTISMLLLGLCVSNLIDELIFNPREFSWNELVGALFACLISLFEYKGWFKLIKVKAKEKYNTVISWWRTWQYVLWRKK